MNLKAPLPNFTELLGARISVFRLIIVANLLLIFLFVYIGTAIVQFNNMYHTYDGGALGIARYSGGEFWYYPAMIKYNRGVFWVLLFLLNTLLLFAKVETKDDKTTMSIYNLHVQMSLVGVFAISEFIVLFYFVAYMHNSSIHYFIR